MILIGVENTPNIHAQKKKRYASTAQRLIFINMT
jgi:hypothetical protein